MIMLAPRFKKSQILSSNEWDESTFTCPIVHHLYQHGYQIKEIKEKNHQENLWQKFSMGQENPGILFDQKKRKVDSSHLLLKRICDCLNPEVSIIILCWCHVPNQTIKIGTWQRPHAYKVITLQVCKAFLAQKKIILKIFINKFKIPQTFFMNKFLII